MEDDDVIENRWRQRLESHPVYAALLDLRARVTELALSVGPEALTEINHLWRVCAQAEEVLARSDPELVTPAMLDRLSAAVATLTAGILSLIQANSQGSPLDWLTLASDGVPDALTGFPSSAHPDLSEELRAQVESLPGQAQSVLSGVEERAGQSVDLLRTQIDDLTAAVERRSADFQTSLDDLTSRVSSQVDLIDQQLLLIQNAQANQANQFSQEQSERRTEYKASLEAFNQEQAHAFSSLQGQYTEFFAQLKSEADEEKVHQESKSNEIFETLQRLEKEAVGIVGVIGRTGMAGGYQEYADDETASADHWRRIAVWVGAATVIALAGVVVWTGVEHHPTWALSIGRLVFAASLVAVSTYAARQSAEHRKRGERARKLELALKSIGPYLESVPIGAREKILEAFAYLFFAAPDLDKPEEGENGLSLLNTIGTLVSQVNNK